MLDTAAQRAAMVASQLRTNDITDPRVLKAMGEIPRERFVSAGMVPVAYMEGCVPAGGGRVLLDPRCFGKLLQLAQIQPSDTILDVGCGTGYSTAVLSHLAARVTGLEERAELVESARAILKALGSTNAQVVQGRLAVGCPEKAPFDVIVLNGAAEVQPESLLAQLNDGGRLVCVLRDGAAGHACLYVKHNGAVGEREAFDAQAPVLPGFEKARGFVF